MAKRKRRGTGAKAQQRNSWPASRALASPLIQAIIRDLVKTAVTAIVVGAVKRRRDRIRKGRGRDG